MRILTSILLLQVLIFPAVLCQSPSSNTYSNPVIPGDHPDATLSRIGNDFYTTGSSFNVTPVIYHSTDLVHWEVIARPVSASWSNFGNTPGGGCWGGQMVYHGGKYWHYFSRANTMYFVKADQPEGPWSQPVMVKNPSTLPYGLGYDNSVFIDDDGKWYLVVKNGQPNNGIVELGDDGQPSGDVYNLSWLNPSPTFPYSWAEGPVMWKAFGYYYYSFARDLSGGQKVMRSATLTAEQSSWEMLGDFFNQNDPLKPASLFTEPNHSSAPVMLDDSTWWVIHPLYAKGEWKGQGRQGLLNQVRYNKNLKPVGDYPVNKAFVAPALPSGGIPWMVPKSDFFTSSKLNPEWSFLGYTPDNTWSLTDRPGWIRLAPNSGRPNTIIKNDGEHNYSLITRMEFDAESVNDEAGLRIMRGDEKKFAKLYLTVNNEGDKIIVFSFDNTRYETGNKIGNIIWLRILRTNHILTGYYSLDGNEWTQVGNTINVSTIDSYSDFTTFTGTRQGIYVQNKAAWFDLYIYRDAYSPIMAGSPANWYGTSGTAAGLLDQIHNNDHAMYAGVEFGNSEYSHAADSVFFTASATNGGNIEIWLDSLDNGTKAGTCEIPSTGSLTVYETFKAPVQNITGRHDVFLKFTGTTTDRLFVLKQIQFHSVPNPIPHISEARTNFGGDTVILSFSHKMIIPDTASFLITKDNDENITVLSIHQSHDSLSVYLTLGSKVYYENELTVSYTGNSVISADSIPLSPVSGYRVINISAGYPPQLISAEVKNNGDQWNLITLKFDGPLSNSAGQEDYFSISINSNNAEIDGLTGKSDSIQLTLANPVHFGDTVTVSYGGGSISGIYHGLLADFENFPVVNNVPVETNYKEIMNTDIMIYPVPFRNNINIKSSTEFSKVRIFDPSGRVVFEKSYSAGVTNDVINLSPDKGLHIVEIKGKSGITYLKINSE